MANNATNAKTARRRRESACDGSFDTLDFAPGTQTPYAKESYRPVHTFSSPPTSRPSVPTARTNFLGTVPQPFGIAPESYLGYYNPKKLDSRGVVRSSDDSLQKSKNLESGQTHPFPRAEA